MATRWEAGGSGRPSYIPTPPRKQYLLAGGVLIGRNPQHVGFPDHSNYRHFILLFASHFTCQWRVEGVSGRGRDLFLDPDGGRWRDLIAAADLGSSKN